MSDNQAKEEQMQRFLIELQIIDSHVKEIQKQIANLDEQMIELAVIKHNIKELEKTKKGTRMLVPLNNGIFAQADLANTKDLLVNVGGGAVVRKSFEDTAKMMDDQNIEITRMRSSLESTLKKLVDQAIAIDKQIGGNDDV